MRYLIAFDKFKSAITAADACKVAESAILGNNPEATLQKAPLTDGGEGFASVIASVTGGILNQLDVPGPLLHPVKGKFAMVEASKVPEAALIRLSLPGLAPSEMIAFVEMASASGYENLTDQDRDPWKTTTYGTGTLIKAALETGAKAIVLGIGGSATNDCGAGALEALGVAYYDRELQEITKVTPEKFKLINTAGSTSHLIDSFPPVRIACDVTNPLLGERGATKVFGPQKGLLPEDVDRMERTMHKMGSRLLGLFGKNPADWDKLMSEPGSGAAGGIGFALRHALPDSQFVEGFQLVSDILSLQEGLNQADCILTGEGRLDASSLAGKGPFSLLESAGEKKQVQLYCGSADPSVIKQLLEKYPNLSVKVISDPERPLDLSLKETSSNLNKAVRELN
jgi:glycerate kinase